jgi:hypothetical protein
MANCERLYFWTGQTVIHSMVKKMTPLNYEVFVMMSPMGEELRKLC